VSAIAARRGRGGLPRLPLTDGELGCMHESAQAIRYTLKSIGF